MNTTTVVPTNASYDVMLHIISLFVILILSFLGASISVICSSSRVKRFHISSIIINTGKFFGSGVILATGFIHMLPAAMEALTDESLPDFWKAYNAFAGLFAMSAAMLIQLIEYIAHQQYRSMNLNDDDHSGHCHGLAFQNHEAVNKVTTYVLELGIAMHSILIGLALGTATDEFVPLFIALCFHQFFEGMALGAQIARLKQISVCSASIMVAFFALTTPIGIGIGIGLQSSAYDPKSSTSLLVSGILDSVSAGILIYTALVNLIATEMGSGAHTFHRLNTRLKVLYFSALYTGAGAMAIVGLWA